MKPTIGRIVHFRLDADTVRPAIITEFAWGPIPECDGVLGRRERQKNSGQLWRRGRG